MHIKTYPFSKLPFSDLFKDYSRQEKSITDFFEIEPYNIDQLKNRADTLKFKGDRNTITGFLEVFNQSFGAGENTLNNIERLKSDESLVVVTGQQMTLYGGPLYTVYKTLTAISTAKQYEKLLNRPVVPVFWLADEDHDAEEISRIGLFDNDELKTCEVEFQNSEIRSGELALDSVIQQLKACIQDSLYETDFSKDLWQLLDKCYHPENNVSTSFGSLLLNLFDNHGLVLAGSNSEIVKNETADLLAQSVEKREEIYNTLSAITQKLIDVGYHGQVHLSDSNLFYITEKNHRVKLQYAKGNWSIEESDLSWTTEELKDDIKKHPNRFSPNVFLRPVMQDRFLPVITYVGGPAEVAYYAQMKGMYEVFDQKMPQILPRFSATIIESSIDRIFEKLPFTLEEYHQRIEDLESQFISQSDTPDIEKIFDDWKSKAKDITDDKKKIIAEIDPTLESSAGKATAAYFTELDKLKGKIYRSLKQQEQTQLDRISRIQSNLFPGGNLQEREIAFIYFLNKYGLDLFDKVQEELLDEIPDSHKLIYI